MSKNSLRAKDKQLLVGRAAMRCEFRGCNKLLSMDQLTRKTENFGAFAHIVADSPNGPRGEEGRSQSLDREVSNFMLLCLDHHKLIDGDHWRDFPEALLREMKAEHEGRILRLTGFKGEHRTHLLILEAAIGGRPPAVDESAAREAVLPRMAQGKTEVSLARSRNRDGEPLFWENAIVEVNRSLLEIEALFARGEIAHVAVFGLAPIPILVWLGYRLGDLLPASIFQKSRVDDENPACDGWRWREQGPALGFELSLTSGGIGNGDVVLWIAVSGEPPIPAELSGLPVLALTIAEPRLDAVTSPAHLRAFRHYAREAMASLEAAPNVHVVSAMPNSCAVEFGRLQLTKVHPRLTIYDRHEGNSGQVRVLEIHGGECRRSDA